MSYPIIINCRDRVSCLKDLVTWLEQAGYEDIFLVDNHSSYEPLLDYYNNISHTIVRLPENRGHLAPWSDCKILNLLRQSHFVVTDPDVVPIEQCPHDAIDYFFNLLMRYPDRTKIGFGLKTDDLPDHYAFKHEVIKWESQFTGGPKLEDNVWVAAIDTTFALYRSGAGPHIDHAARTGFPYLARHLTWYINSADPGEEYLYYRSHAWVGESKWGSDSIPIDIQTTMPK